VGTTLLFGTVKLLLGVKFINGTCTPHVSKWAKILLEGGIIHYRGDPVHDLDLIGFLDCFSYKQPKKDVSQYSLTQPPKTVQ